MIPGDDGLPAKQRKVDDMKAFVMATIIGVALATTGAVSAKADHDNTGGFATEALRKLTEQGG